MPLLDKEGVTSTEIFPGVNRWSIVDGTRGSQSLTVSEVVMEPGSSPPLHYHPTEEAMLIVEGELEAIVGDDVFQVKAGQIVLGPPGIPHGFVNRSNARAIVYGIHPTNNVQTTIVE